MDSPRCPVCNRIGKKDHPLNYCTPCEKGNRKPECMISKCNQPVEQIGNRFARYCQEHLYGEEGYLSRKDFTSDVAEKKHGYRQEDAEEFSIISDEFPIRRT
jgi:hypothetical protein